MGGDSHAVRTGGSTRHGPLFCHGLRILGIVGWSPTGTERTKPQSSQLQSGCVQQAMSDDICATNKGVAAWGTKLLQGIHVGAKFPALKYPQHL